MKALLNLVLFLAIASTTVAADGKAKNISVSVKVPDGGWKISIDKIYMVQNEFWVVSRLSRKEGMAVQMISTISDSVAANIKNLPVKHFVLGKTWNWPNKEPYTFLNDLKTIEKKLREGKLMYSRSRRDKDK